MVIDHLRWKEVCWSCTYRCQSTKIDKITCYVLKWVTLTSKPEFFNLIYKMSEKLCLQWNDFKENATSAFGSLREDRDFADVTLACEDGNQFEAHKVILATSSPFFQNILRRNQHVHPLIFMRGLKSEDLAAIIDFLYCGEANVYQENLDSFLAIAEELQLKGLTGKSNDKVESEENSKTRKAPEYKKESHLRRPSAEPPLWQAEAANQKAGTGQNEHDTGFGTVALTRESSGDLQELDNQIISMMVKTSKKSVCGNPLYECKNCGKEARKANLKNHIEANHLEGISVPCNQCEKTFRSRSSLATHKSVFHKHSTSTPSAMS